MTTPPIIQGAPVHQQKLPLSGACSLFITVFLIVMIISTAITFILPESFASTARIKLDIAPAKDSLYLVQTEFEVIQSQVVLGKVIQNMNLNDYWGHKFFNGETLKTYESLKILRSRLTLAPVGNTKLIAITSFSDDRREAAQVANAVAAAYQEYCLEQQKTNAAKSTSPTVEIIDSAEPAAKPCKPNKPLNLVLGAVAGVVLGSMAAAGWLLLFRRQELLR
ncbi:MAG: G-rich domain on putative tyrosine kinase [Verrucomicrobiota bacterium]|jgi:uncharacterized protein involved in exopolysaccharide biosynthesis